MTVSSSWRQVAAATAILTLAACGDDSNSNNAAQTDAARAAEQVTAQAKGGGAPGPATVSRGEQLYRDAERIANAGRDLEARQTFERALAAFKSANDRPGEGKTLVAMGSLDRAMGQGERGRQVLRDADAVYTALNDPKGRAETAFALGELERAQFNNETSRQVFDRAAGLFRAASDWSGEARSLLGRADVERRLAHILSAQRSAARAQAIYTVLRETQNATLARRSLEEVTTNYPDDNEEAREALRTEALQLEQAGDLPGEAMVVLRIAALEHNAGRPAQAREAYNRALDLLRSEQQQQAGLVRALTGLGDLERDLEFADAAISAYTTARGLAQQLSDPVAQGAILVGLADVERSRGGATAAQLAQEARELFQRAGNRAGEAAALVAQARIALKANDVAAAERAITDAQQAAPADDAVAAQVQRTLADVQRAKSDAAAIETYRKALAAFEASGTRLGEAWSLLGLGRALAGTSPTEAKVNLLLAANAFATLGMEARRAEASAAAAAIN